MFEITERWLMDAGGWQAMKPARALWQGGGVLAVEFDGVRLRGQVRAGGRVLACGLVIKSRTDVNNLCACPVARREGALCEHSLALGLAWAAQQRGGGAGREASLAKVARASSPLSQHPGEGAARDPSRAESEPPGIDAGPVKAVAPVACGHALAFALAGNFSDGLKRNRLVVAITPVPDQSGDRAGELAHRSLDAPFLRWLALERQTRVPPNVALSDRRQIDTLFGALAGHPRVSAGGHPWLIGAAPVRLPLIMEKSSGDMVRLKVGALVAQGAAVIAPSQPSEPGWVIDPASRQILPWRVSPTFFDLLPTLDSRPPWIEKPLRWLAGHLDALQDNFVIDEQSSDAALLRIRTTPGQPEFSLELEGSLERLSAKLSCRYPHGPPPFAPMSQVNSGFPVHDPARPNDFLNRNPAAESAAVRRLEQAGFAFDPAVNHFILRKEGTILQFFAGDLERLKSVWKITLGERFAAATRNVERVAPQWRPVAAGEDWLTFDLEFASEQGSRISRAEIQRLLQTGQGHRRLPNGRIAVVALDQAADFEEVLRDVNPDQSSGHFRVRQSQLGYLEQSLGPPSPSQFDFPQIEHGIDWNKYLSINGLDRILRDYQKAGFEWLCGLASRNLGGILADEMGLGKTLQSLAVIAMLRTNKSAGPALVVCPKSLLSNWEQEAGRFVPDIRCLVVRSGERKGDLARLGDFDLVITSYPLLALDVAHYAPLRWSAVFLDEAGFIRNPDTQAAKAVRRLDAGCRVALTGTPLENSVRDLWSIMDFAVPGYLGHRDDFRERYELPLGASGGIKILGRLRRRLVPYLLRRLKEEVAKDLPSKIEKVFPCELSALQRELYAKILRESKERILEAEGRKQSGPARMTMLTALLRLRQTCCDARLLGIRGEGERDASEASGKMAALEELLDEIHGDAHSVLIFSQFASMLRLIRETLESMKLGFCHLDGSTVDRESQIRAFRDDPDKRVFLISLKAGGFGLNLTKADTVIHFDPWWNPAVEAQATDRAHRIGQSKPVTVYKLIATGTVEEKILRLQQRKQGIMNAALDDETPIMDGLSNQDLRALVIEG